MKMRVENDLFLERETSSGAILNTDRIGYDSLMANKRRKIERDVSMKNEIDELKSLVAKLIEGK